MKAPFPWFGGKRRVAPLVWAALGDVDNYVEPFAGSLAVLLERPLNHRRTAETVNDRDYYLANFLVDAHLSGQQKLRLKQRWWCQRRQPAQGAAVAITALSDRGTRVAVRGGHVNDGTASTDKAHYRQQAAWRYRRWRAAHHQWAAWVQYLRWPTPTNARALDRADVLCRQLEDRRP